MLQCPLHPSLISVEPPRTDCRRRPSNLSALFFLAVILSLFKCGRRLSQGNQANIQKSPQRLGVGGAHTAGDRTVAHWQAVPCSHPHRSYRPSYAPASVLRSDTTPPRASFLFLFRCEIRLSFLPLSFSDRTPSTLFLVARPRSEPQSTAALLSSTRRALVLVIGQVRR
jgi:hypothetical protein